MLMISRTVTAPFSIVTSIKEQATSFRSQAKPPTEIKLELGPKLFFNCDISVVTMLIYISNITYIHKDFFSISQILKRSPTVWTVWESNPGGGEIIHTRPDQAWGPPSPLYSGYRVFFPG
jgi:hypothetical protein